MRKAAGARLLSGAEVLGLWAFSRVLVIFVAGAFGSDLPFYADVQRALASGRVPYRDLPLDHPPLALALMAVPGLVAPAAYAAAFRGMMLGIDLAVLILIGRLGAIADPIRRGRTAQLLYVWLGALLFPLLFDRFDPLLGLLVLLLPWLAARGRFLWGWAALAAAAALNAGAIWLWPCWALAERAFARPGRGLRHLTFAAALAGAALLAGVRVLGPGFTAFARYHWSGAVEVESLPATLLMLAAPFTGRWPGIDASTGVLRLSVPGATWVGPALLVAMAVWLLARDVAVATRLARGDAVTWSPAMRVRWLAAGALAHLLAFQLSCSVFLPQYTTWLSPLAAAGLSILQPGRWWVALWIAVAIYTVSGVPLGMRALDPLSFLGAAILVLRNGLLAAAFAWTLQLWRRAERDVERRDPAAEAAAA